MSEKYKNTYRIESARLRHWDYGWKGAYFVTICTHKKERYFGNIVNNEIELSEIGKIAERHWHEIPEQFSYVKLDRFVIMPNHVHGIVVISGNTDVCRDAINRVCTGGNTMDCNDVNVCDNTTVSRDAINRVSTVATNTGNNITKIGGITGKNNPMLSNNVSRVVRWYKGRVTFESRNIDACFKWQTRFYDHIIRDDQSYYRIQQYIDNNPANWRDDEYNVL